ncbi:uncharacterized protein LOC144646470 isoform X1 [Oculina patagonica]
MKSGKILLLLLLTVTFVALMQNTAATESASLLDMLTTMDDTENDMDYPRGCTNKYSLLFCKRWRAYCRRSNKNYRFMEKNCKYTCGLCH